MGGLQEKEEVFTAKAGKRQDGEIIIFLSFSATVSLFDVGKSVKVNVLYVVLKGHSSSPTHLT